jgi:hypothetical protein
MGAHKVGMLAAQGQNVSVAAAPGGDHAAGRFLLPLLLGAAAGYKLFVEDQVLEKVPTGIRPEQMAHIEATLISPMTALAGEIRSSKATNSEEFKPFLAKVSRLRPTVGAVGGATGEASSAATEGFQEASEFVNRAETVLLGATLSLGEAAPIGVQSINDAEALFVSLPVVAEAPPEPGQPAPTPTGITPLQRQDLEATVLGPAREAKAMLEAQNPDFPEAIDRLTLAMSAAATFRTAYNLPPALMVLAREGRNKLVAAQNILQASLKRETATDGAAFYLELAAGALKKIPVVGGTAAEPGAAPAAPAAAPAAPPPG